MAYLRITIHGYLLGVMQGGSTVFALCGLLATHVAISGAMPQVSGAWGEDNTRDYLRWARRRRLIYGWVDNLEVEGGDVDHLVATPAGWLAIDSKWHGRSLDIAVIARDAESGARAARRARLILLGNHQHVDVQPLIVVWGGAQDEVPHGNDMAYGVEFVAGSHLKTRLRAPSEVQLDRATARKVLSDLHDFRKRVAPPSMVTRGRTKRVV